jgi:nucleoside-diphosphate-sugar epimerase
MEPAHVEAVLSAHARAPIEHYVFISTNMVYPGGVDAMDISGEQPGESAARREDAAAAPMNYGGKKLKCEAMLERAAAAAAAGLPSTVLRPPAVVGAGCDPRHEKLHRFVAGLPPLPPPAKRRAAARWPKAPFRVAHAVDVASAVVAVVDRQPIAPAEAFNVASGSAKGVTLDEYTALMSEALAKIAEGGGPGQSGRGEVRSVPDDEVDLRNYEKQGAIDTSKAEHELGFKPMPIASWMSETVAWHIPLLEME